jgi:lipid-binding SYLF domain-containing protein
MRVVLTSTLCLFALLAATVRANDDRLESARTVLVEMAGMADKGIPHEFFAKAQCVVIIPAVKKAALGVGGQYGRGYISCRKQGGWSAPAGMRIEGGSFGLQLGGSSTDVILLVMNQKGADHLLSDQFKVGADILAWSRSRGLFAGISLQGSTLRGDDGEDKELYGRDLTTREIITGNITPPKSAAGLMAALANY